MQRKALPPSRYPPFLMSMALGCATPKEGTPPIEQPPGLIPELVKDLNAGPTARFHSGSPGAFVSIGTTTFFIAQGQTTGYELWKSDGTTAGTVLVKDVAPGKESGADGLTAFGNTLFFTGGDRGTSSQLWTSDGTAAGTQPFSPDKVNGIGYLTSCNGKLLFFGTDADHGSELWRSDGTEAGTVLIKDSVPGPTGLSVFFTGVACVNGKLLFQRMAGNGLELWTSDGSAEGTGALVSGLQLDTWPPVTVGGALFFVANDGVRGRELWTSDGTPGGTHLVKDIQAGTGEGIPSPFFAEAYQPTRVLKGVGNTVFFLADDGVHGVELWASDGTEAGTRLVKDIAPGATSSNPVLLRGLNGELLLQADDGVHGLQLWKSNGTEAGTQQVTERAAGWLDASGVALAEVDGALLFTSGQRLRNLYRTDGTDAGTVLLQQLPEGELWVPPEGGVPPLYAFLGNRLLWPSKSVSGFNIKARLWVTNGTAAGTIPLATNLANTPAWMRQAEGYVVFQGEDTVHGIEPWVTDGTVEGTKVLRDIVPANSSGPESLVDMEGSLYFAAYDAEHGTELRKSDGTAEGTTLIKDINTGIHRRGPYLLKPAASQLFFFNEQPDFKHALWKTDGTETGTVRLKPLTERANEAASMGTSLFFTVQDPSLGRELWKSDGTEAGTVLIKDILPGYRSGIDTSTAFAGVGNKGRFAFVASDEAHGMELWMSDGTAGGTVQFQDIAPGAESSTPQSLTVSGSRLLFTANDGVNGHELWAAKQALFQQ